MFRKRNGSPQNIRETNNESEDIPKNDLSWSGEDAGGDQLLDESDLKLDTNLVVDDYKP